MNNSKFTIRRILVIGLAACLGLVVLLAVRSISNRGKAAFEVRVAPQQAIIKVNNNRVGNRFRLKPGQYELLVYSDGFKSYKKKFDVRQGDSVAKLAIALSPESDTAKKIADKQSDTYHQIEAESGKQSQQQGVDLLKQSPILQNIPYRSTYYNIDYRKDNTGKIFIEITAETALGRQVAMEKIRSWGFEPTDYAIDFLGIPNPFEAYSEGS